MRPTRIAAQAGFIGATVLLVISTLMGRWEALAIAGSYLGLWYLGFGITKAIQTEDEEDERRAREWTGGGNWLDQ